MKGKSHVITHCMPASHYKRQTLEQQTDSQSYRHCCNKRQQQRKGRSFGTISAIRLWAAWRNSTPHTHTRTHTASSQSVVRHRPLNDYGVAVGRVRLITHDMQLCKVELVAVRVRHNAEISLLLKILAIHFKPFAHATFLLLNFGAHPVHLSLVCTAEKILSVEMILVEVFPPSCWPLSVAPAPPPAP
eukprot:Opistho-2@2917